MDGAGIVGRRISASERQENIAGKIGKLSGKIGQSSREKIK